MISEGTRRAGPYTTDGVQEDFTFDFKVFEGDDAVVTLGDDGDETVLVYASDYTVVLNGDQDNNPGGTITLVAPASWSGPDLYITSDVPIEQPAVFTNTGGFYPRVLNDALDRLTIYIQQVWERLTRALILPLDPTGLVGKYPVVDADGSWTYASGTGNDANLRSDLAGDTGGALVGWIRSATGAVRKSLATLLFGSVMFDTEFGVVADGVTDDAAATNAFFAALMASNVTRAVMRPGNRLFLSDVTCDRTGVARAIHIDATGVSIATSGSVDYAIRIKGSYPPYRFTLSGLNVDDPNASCDIGILLEQASNVRLPGCTVTSNVSAKPTPGAGSYGYKAVALKETHFAAPDASHPDTGCFWFRGEDIGIRISGNDLLSPTEFDLTVKKVIAFYLEGAQNAFRLEGASIANVYAGVAFANVTGQSDGVAVGAFIAADFEDVTYPVLHLRRDGQPLPQGLIVDFSGFESVDTVLMAVNVQTPGNTDFGANYSKPVLGPDNTYIPTVTKLVDGPAGILNNVDIARTGTTRDERTLNYSKRGHRLRSDDTTYDTLTLEIGNVGTRAGLGIETAVGALLGGFRYVASGVMELFGAVGNGVHLTLSGVVGISTSTTRANNLAGSATATGAATTAVWTFTGGNETDTNYTVTYCPVSKTATPAAGSNRVATVTKAVGSVTLNLEAAPGVGNTITFDVHLIRNG